MKIIHVIDKANKFSGPLDRAREIKKNLNVMIIACDVENGFKFGDVENETNLRIRTKFNLTILFKLAKTIKKFDADIVNTHHHYSGLVVRILKIFGVINQKVVHSFGNDFNSFNLIAKILHTITLPFISGVVFVSESNKNAVNNFSAKFFPRKQTVIKNGVNLHEFCNLQFVPNNNSKNLLPNNYKGFVIVSIGRFIEQKDHETLLHAFSILRNEYNIPSKLILIGDGELRTKLELLTVQFGIEKDVIFPGFINRYKVYQILNNSDLYVMSSKWEGLCVSLLQAMAIGLPVVVSDIKPFVEVVEDRKEGLTFRTGEEGQMAIKMRILLKDRKLAKEIGNSAKQKVAKFYSIEKTAEEYALFYQSLHQS